MKVATGKNIRSFILSLGNFEAETFLKVTCEVFVQADLTKRWEDSSWYFYLKRMGQPRRVFYLFIYYLFKVQNWKIVATQIWTQIGRVEGKDADH